MKNIKFEETDPLVTLEVTFVKTVVKLTRMQFSIESFRYTKYLRVRRRPGQAILNSDWTTSGKGWIWNLAPSS